MAIEKTYGDMQTEIIKKINEIIDKLNLPIQTVDIADGAVTSEKLATGLDISAQTIKGTNEGSTDNYLLVNSSSTINGDLDVKGNATIQHNLTVVYDTELQGDTTFDGTATFNGNIEGKKATFKSSVNTSNLTADSITGIINGNDSSNFTGETSFQNIDVSNLANIKDLVVTGKLTTNEEDIQIKDEAHFQRGASVAGDFLVEGTSTLTGVTVKGTGTFTNGINANGSTSNFVGVNTAKFSVTSCRLNIDGVVTSIDLTSDTYKSREAGEILWVTNISSLTGTVTYKDNSGTTRTQSVPAYTCCQYINVSDSDTNYWLPIN